MKRISAVVRVIVVTLAVLGGKVATPLAPPATAASISLTDLKTRALYYQRINDLPNRQATVDSISRPRRRASCDGFSPAGTRPTPARRSTPRCRPICRPRAVFVVLGSALKSTGAISAKIVRRLGGHEGLGRVSNSAVLVTGGAPKNGFTEGQVMHDWLVAAGIPETRILVEK